MKIVTCDCCGGTCDGRYRLEWIRPKSNGVIFDVYFPEEPSEHDFCSFPCLAEWTVRQARNYRGDAPNEATGVRLSEVFGGGA